jgi:PncC family amidohydrolase
MPARRLVELAERLQAACLARGLTVATAESCTGGLVAEALTAVAGSSGYVRGGVVAYHNDVKQAALGVPGPLLEAHGAVSPEVAVAMADGARERLAASVAVSVTGVAGPDGGTAAKPVGLVYVGLAGPGRRTDAERLQLDGDRASIREAAAEAAIRRLLQVAESPA